MADPLVSVVMTAYNCEKYLKDSLQSIFNQTFKDFEIIFYDDASTDNTWKIAIDLCRSCSSFFKGGVSMSRGRVNFGCGEGRNKAIKNANGKYIAIHDSDDISLPDRLEKEISFLEANDDVFCVGGWADKVDENKEFIETMSYPRSSHEEIYQEMMVKKNNPIIDPSCMYRRDMFNELRGYDNNWELVPDFNLWVRAAQNGCKFANLEEVLVLYRQHPNSVTNKDREAVIREHFKMCKMLLS